ncbi:3-deoxy-7-phosphoheptulonate synthase [Candidatus Parcubacteria bacterium]|nr:MAG: 3-deoxy-7-phosphoheptulonate synthase [Candidatus Parcubacteria bacterium]
MKDISQGDIQNNLPLVTQPGSVRPVQVGSVEVGGKDVVAMAGPCTVESRDQVMRIAEGIKKSGAQILRGGVFKPLTFPYGDPLGQPDRDSDGEVLGRTHILSKAEQMERAEKRFVYLREAGDAFDLPVVSEVLYADGVPMMEKYVDMFQIGYRHMFNFDLIYALSETSKPILLKRHYGESLRSLLGVAEHFFARGKKDLVLCERGVAVPHTHNVESRAVIDIQAVAALKEYAPTIPVVIDPSHSTFKRSYVLAISRAGVAAGADGILIDVHYDPENAWVDPLQALNFEDFGTLMSEVKGISEIIKR